MFPVLFRIGSFELTSFGAMMAVAALVGVWIFRRELRRSSLPESAVDAAVAGVTYSQSGTERHLPFDTQIPLLRVRHFKSGIDQVLRVSRSLRSRHEDKAVGRIR